MKRDSGLTLLELLVAITLFVIIAGVSYGIFATAMKSMREYRVSSSFNANCRDAWRYLSRDLRCAHSPHFSGSSGLEFVTYSADDAGYCRVKYYIDSERGLVKEIRPLALPEAEKLAKTIVVAPQAVAMDLNFFDGKQWYDSWASGAVNEPIWQNESIPFAVKIRIKVADESFETIVPIFESEATTLETIQ